MANAKFSTLATQFQTNAAAIATAAGGSVVTSDIAVLANILKTLSLRNDMAFAIMRLLDTSLASVYLTPG